MRTLLKVKSSNIGLGDLPGRWRENGEDLCTTDFSQILMSSLLIPPLTLKRDRLDPLIVPNKSSKHTHILAKVIL